MREVEGMSYEEMAEAMGISKGTIMSRLYHARRKLQRALKEVLHRRDRASARDRRRRGRMTPDDRDLMAYHDGELSPRDRARVAAWLATDRAARTAPRRVVRDALAGARLGGVAERSLRRDRAGHARDRGASRLARALGPSGGGRLARRRSGGRRDGCARAWSLPSSSKPASVEAALVSSSGAPAGREEATGARVESVDFGDNSGSIFVLGSSAGTTTVIWMNDLPENRRRIEAAMNRAKFGRLLLPLLLLAQAPESSLAAPAPAELDDAPKKPEAPAYAAEILVLHATNEKKGIDPRIGDMPELKAPPFSSYDSYALLDKARLPLVKSAPKQLKLPNGRILETKLLEVLPNDSLRISASINQPEGGEFLPLLEVKAKVGQSFIVAGQSYKNGILVLVIRVVKMTGDLAARGGTLLMVAASGSVSVNTVPRPASLWTRTVPPWPSMMSRTIEARARCRARRSWW